MQNITSKTDEPNPFRVSTKVFSMEEQDASLKRCDKDLQYKKDLTKQCRRDQRDFKLFPLFYVD